MNYLEYILIILSALSLSVVAIHFTATIFTIIYQQYLYKNRVRSRFDPHFTPSVSIIIPVKGNSPSLKKNLKSFFNQNYPNFEILFCVENKNEPAIPVIEEVVTEHKNSQLVIARLSKTCCQKNQNILSALHYASHPEVYVFADNDKIVDIDWLKELILPLSSSKITATSTYFWPKTTSNSSIGALSHALMNIYIYTIYSYATNFLGTSLLWGGSMAIRRKTFDKLRVAKYWSTSVVDDTSLSKIIADHKHKTIFVPTALCQATKSYTNLHQSYDWFTRQIMYLKLYRRNLWFHIIGWIAIVHIFNYLMLLTSIVYIALNREITPLLFIPLIFVLLDIFNSLFLIFLGPIKNFHHLLLYTPIIRFIELVAYIKTYFSYTIEWSGISYEIKKTGEVAQIKR